MIAVILVRILFNLGLRGPDLCIFCILKTMENKYGCQNIFDQQDLCTVMYFTYNKNCAVVFFFFISTVPKLFCVTFLCSLPLSWTLSVFGICWPDPISPNQQQEKKVWMWME